MVDIDIDEHHARRLLSAPSCGLADDAPGPGGWTRRRFLQAVGMGVVAGPAIATFGRDVLGTEAPPAWAAPPIAASDGILVVISLYGGNDGLNTVVPHATGAYYDLRPGLAIPAADVLDIDGTVGFHPELAYLSALSDAGQVAVVQGVGHPDPDYSHFRSMGIWMAGSFVPTTPGTGWIGRWLDRLPATTADLAAASIDLSVPLHMVGAERRAVGVSPSGEGFGVDTSADRRRLFDCVRQMATTSGGRGAWHDAFASTMRQQLDLAASLQPVFTSAVTGGEIARKLTVAARLVNADLGFRVIDVGCGGFDHHEQQWRSHPALLRDLDDGLRSFFATLAPHLQNRVTLMTVSEFGRTPRSNGSNGTDHGSAAPLMVVGAAVKGGLYGQAPSLTALDTNGQMRATVDFRSVYGSVLDGWMGGGASEIVGASFEDLRLFRSAPGAPLTGRATPIVVAPPASASGFVAIAPRRILDTRVGTGDRATPIGAGETWSFPLRGWHGVPADAVAVALNLTSVGATSSTYVTVWPTGLNRPIASSLNPQPGRAVPNTVVVRLGASGGLDVYNHSGSVDLVADLVGWFAPSSTNGLVPLSPSRLMDTRDATGGTSGSVGPGETVELQVAGRGGVPVGATAAALNVAATEPTDASHLTVWPSGSPRPLASSLNMVQGQTVSNLVLAGIGDGGRISICNNSGSTHIVVDVLGALAPDAGRQFVSLAPARIIDTRDGTGTAVGRVGGAPLTVSMLGRGGLPAAGISAVVLNVTAVLPTRDAFVTVYPAGVERPLAANLNVTAGDVVPNMVIGTLGAGGSLAFFVSAGDVDLVADVVGYFIDS